MPSFAYKARDEAGGAVAGTMQAISEEELSKKLRSMNYMPFAISASTSTKTVIKKAKSFDFSFQKIKTEEIILFNVQLAGMIDAGMTLLNCLNIISRQLEGKKFKSIVDRLIDSVAGGETFSDALAQHPEAFSPLYISMIRAGEMSGTLNTVLNRLAVYVEQQEDLRKKVQGALFYPAILCVVGLGVVVIIVTFVIPKFALIFTQAGIDLPLPTRILFAIGVAFKKFWYLLIIGSVLFGFGAKQFFKGKIGKNFLDRFVFKIPLIGVLIRKVIIARFCRTLSTLVDSGVPLLQCLDIMKDVVGNEVFRKVVTQVYDSVERGRL